MQVTGAPVQQYKFVVALAMPRLAVNARHSPLAISHSPLAVHIANPNHKTS